MRKKTSRELLGLSPDFSRTDSGMESTPLNARDGF